METRYHLVADDGGARLDRFASERCPDLSRSQVQKLIREGCVKVKGRTARSSLRLEAGDEIDIAIPSLPLSPLAPENIPLDIVYEDADVLVVDKPAGLTVHPAPGSPHHTLVNAIIARFPHLADMGDSLRPGIVHRLDKDTSGLILVAKNRKAQMALIEQFKSRSITKTYVALVKGKLTPERGVIEAAVGRDPANRKRMAVVRDGREARTGYKVIRYLDDFTLLEAVLETGRTHQIRVHLSAIGYPVVGDATYGVRSPYLSRQFLHASRLGFRLPSSGEYVEFKSGLPEDLKRALNKIR
jgi:23S rRNA pseudouridine1911/1915/1917 synthase